jgi:hypothetical protein
MAINLKKHAALNNLDENLELKNIFFSFGATAPIWAMAYLHEIFRFTSVF